MEENFSCLYLFLRSTPAGLCPKKIGDWLLISLQFYLTGVFPALINPCHLHTFYDRVNKKTITQYSNKIFVNNSRQYTLRHDIEIPVVGDSYNVLHMINKYLNV